MFETWLWRANLTMSSSVFETLTSQQQEAILTHLDCVMEANKITNLTRIDDKESALILHVEDSLSALAEIEDSPLGLYGDMGTGAGYPGIPLAIATGRKTMLIDAREKKVKVLNGIIETLHLTDQVSTYAGRVELLARKKPGAFTVLTARALAKLSVLLELASPLLAKKGCLICYKAQISDEELNDAMRVQSIVGMTLKSDRSFVLSDGVTKRRIVVFEKTGKPQIKLPRLEGKAQKDPL